VPHATFCQLGLQSTYGITFKDFKALDADGPLTRAALKNGSIQVGLVFSSDADLNALGLVVLQDDTPENADNVVPILQCSRHDEVKTVLNNIDAKLTTADPVTMNQQVSLLHQTRRSRPGLPPEEQLLQQPAQTSSQAADFGCRSMPTAFAAAPATSRLAAISIAVRNASPEANRA
jgi:hypothetical protein